MYKTDYFSFSFRTLIKIALIICFVNIFNSSFSQIAKKEKTRILFIFDASQSMNGIWENSKKINVAKKFLIEMIDSLQYEKNIEMALRIYGHQSIVPPQDCSDTRLEVKFTPNNADEIKQKLRYLIPKGTTPIANSLAQAANDFPEDNPNVRNIIILITDGVEACDGDPCIVSKDLQKRGIILKPFVIGIGLDENFKKSFDCIGRFLEVTKEQNFSHSLNYVISQVMEKTSSQINLLDKNGSPKETNIPISLYDNRSGKLKYQYIHTINALGNPDTLYLDPLVTYDMVVHTIPNINKDSISISSGQHNIIGVKCPQGTLEITSNKGHKHRSLQTIIRKDNKIINTQITYEKVKYLKGKYNLEILTMPPTIINNVDIKASETTSIDIPQPGLLTIFKPGYGECYVFVKKGNKLEYVCQVKDKNLRKTLYLQPGIYHINYRKRNSYKMIETINKEVKVKSNISIPIRL
ncbi:MAG: VWA domain-containing protein [Marinifilaceae bacterium]|jgi:Ca-activated chloride channel family protein|nr:VWA domain-containing protein [Marinifilaceae bacterium]